MSQTKLEMQLEITHLHGNSDMLKPRLLLILALVLLLIGTAWGQSCVRSIGSGPSFGVYPAIVIAGPDGHFQFSIVSRNPSTEYEVLLNGRKVILHGKIKKIRSEIPFGKLYSYLVVKSIGRWESSSATVLVLSPNLKKINVDKEISMLVIPQVFGYKSTESGTLVAVLNAGFGRKNLEISLDNATLVAVKLSPISNFPKVFEARFNTEKLANGKHLLRARLFLITGEKVVATTTIFVQKYFAPPVIQSLEISPKVVAPQRVTFMVSVVVKDKTEIKSVEIDGVAAKRKDGKWEASIPENFSKVKESGTTKLNFQVKATNIFNKSSEATFSKKICVDVNPPRIKIESRVKSVNNSYVLSKSELPLVLKVIATTDSGVKPTVIVKLDGISAGTRVRISEYGMHTLTVNATNPVNGLSNTIKYKFVLNPLPSLTMPTWWLIGIFASIIALLLFTIY